MAQVVLNLHIVDDSILLLTDLNFVLRQALDLLLWHQSSSRFDRRARPWSLKFYPRVLLLRQDLSSGLLAGIIGHFTRCLNLSS